MKKSTARKQWIKFVEKVLYLMYFCNIIQL